MARIFGASKKGCYMVHTMDFGTSRGAWLQLPGGTKLPTDSLGDPYWVSAFDISLSEDRAVSKNIGDVNYVYAFGHNASQSNASVTLTAVMEGSFGGGGGSPVLSKLIQAYIDNRVYAQESPAVIVLEGQTAAQGFIDGFAAAPQLIFENVIQVSFRMTIPQINNMLS